MHELKFMSSGRVAAMLGLPKRWLRAETKANRIPHIQAGCRILLHPAAVEQVLAERSALNLSSAEGGEHVKPH